MARKTFTPLSDSPTPSPRGRTADRHPAAEYRPSRSRSRSASPQRAQESNRLRKDRCVFLLHLAIFWLILHVTRKREAPVPLIDTTRARHWCRIVDPFTDFADIIRYGRARHPNRPYIDVQ